jgi:hypothetical protein
MGALAQVLEIIFEMQKKNEQWKNKRRKINFPTYKTHFILFYFLDPSYFQTS